MQTLLVSILVFGLIIAVHEFGHFIMAKAVGIKVDEFSIGMGPKIASVNGEETLYSLRAIPIGGYVKMEGEYDMENPSAPVTDPRNFNNKPVYQRIMVVIAGVVMNFVLAMAIFTFLGLQVGVPVGNTVLKDIVPGSPAEQAGFLPGDIILEANGRELRDRSDLDTVIKTNPNKEITFTVLRDDSRITLTPVIGEGEERLGFLGIIGEGYVIEKQNLAGSLRYAVNETLRLLTFIVASISFLFSGQIGIDSFAGPVGIVRVIDETARVGFYPLLYLLAFMSANIGFLNLLPIPGLDGSKILFLLYEGILGRPIDRKKEGIITMIGFAFLLSLFLLITFNDIIKFFN